MRCQNTTKVSFDSSDNRFPHSVSLARDFHVTCPEIFGPSGI
jgi:hypothetical protein